MRAMLTLLFLLALATPALASDGMLEISQTCAVNTGCFSGDAAGYPVTISLTGRSFVLTSRLFVPDENTDAIVVSVPRVSIDLGGFDIGGPVTCSGIPLVCTPGSGTGAGVTIGSLGTFANISVKNGSITGMGNYGVYLPEHAKVTNLAVYSNGSSGIRSGAGSIVSGNTSNRNGGDGIGVGSGSTISGNVAFENGSSGIFADSGSTVSGNAANGNAGQGIRTQPGSTVSGNTTVGNASEGIQGAWGSTIVDNAIVSNGSTNLHDGIECSSGCTVRGNSVRSNSGYGLNLGTDSAYSDNVVTANTTGTVTGAGSTNSRGGNYCAGTGAVLVSCP